jgi:hypothetical protein
MKGILFDMPAVVESAAEVIEGYGLNGRCQIVGGDFFSSVPAGADAYIMRHVIHDWEDNRAVTILRSFTLVTGIQIPLGTPDNSGGYSFCNPFYFSCLS